MALSSAALNLFLFLLEPAHPWISSLVGVSIFWKPLHGSLHCWLACHPPHSCQPPSVPSPPRNMRLVPVCGQARWKTHDLKGEIPLHPQPKAMPHT